MKSVKIALGVAMMFCSLPFAQAQNESISNEEDQKTPIIHEGGLSLTDLTSFGLSYRFGKNHTFFRIRPIAGSSNSSSSSTAVDMSNQALDEDWSGHRLGVALGIERRVKLKKEEVQFKYGFDIGYIYDVQDRNWNSSANNEQSLEIKTNSILANLVFGINYLPSDRFILSLEVMPGIQIVKSKQSQTVRTEFFDEVTTSSQTTQIDSVFLNSGLVAPRFTISYRI